MRLAGRIAGIDHLAGAGVDGGHLVRPGVADRGQLADSLLKRRTSAFPLRSLGRCRLLAAADRPIQVDEGRGRTVRPPCRRMLTEPAVPPAGALAAKRSSLNATGTPSSTSATGCRPGLTAPGGTWGRGTKPTWPVPGRVLPVVQAGQRRTVALTDAYLARATRTRPVGLVADDLIGAAVRNGTDPADVYRRPFVQLWSALSNGAQFMDAMNAAGVRAAQSASTDVSLTMRASAGAFDAQAADEARIVGWERVLTPTPAPTARPHPRSGTGPRTWTRSTRTALSGPRSWSQAAPETPRPPVLRRDDRHPHCPRLRVPSPRITRY